MGKIDESHYTAPKQQFNCPLTGNKLLGLNDFPNVIDALRVVHKEDIPLSQRSPSDTRLTKIVKDEVMPAATVKFYYKSGTSVEITSGRRFPSHSDEIILYSGMTGGVAWPFYTRELESSMKHIMSLQLVPWHHEKDVYMGISALAAYKSGQGPDAQLWLINNIANKNVHHHIIIRLPISEYIPATIDPRNLPAIRDDIGIRVDLQSDLFNAASAWLRRCEFSKEI